MIRRLYDPRGEVFAADYYGIKTAAYVKAYGLPYDFCRLYGTGSGHILLFNSNAVISGGGDISEISDFLRVLCPQTAECPAETGEKLRMPEYDKIGLTLFGIKKTAEYSGEDITADPPLAAAVAVIEECFPETDISLWYTDMSHRIRHGVSRLYMYGNASLLSVDFSGSGKAYISCVGTLPESRGKGCAARLLSYAADNMPPRTEGYLWAEDGAAGYYRKIGFAEVKKGIKYRRRFC
ncbi:MAG: GNAT family N-acetyltransferase [Ruminococcus sp.]|nr:GNAT family N-acetyltransferase [Ruminococcus sp.]